MLAQGVRAFGFGDHSRALPSDGTREVRELSAAFARMRSEIINTNRALLESEKLVTIGRMASSVSHDLRHYLAAVYANAEFLSSPRLSEQERHEFFADIHIAVHGATELLESLLIFSKTGAVYHRERNSLVRIVEKCVSLLRAHPEAEGVTIRMECADPSGGICTGGREADGESDLQPFAQRVSVGPQDGGRARGTRLDRHLGEDDYLDHY